MFIHVFCFLPNAHVKDAAWKRRPLLCFLGRYQNRHLWKKTIAYWTGVKQMFYKISALFCLLVWYHRWWRQKEGAWLNKTYWPIKYNKIYDIIYIYMEKKQRSVKKTCDMCSLARHPKKICIIERPKKKCIVKLRFPRISGFPVL